MLAKSILNCRAWALARSSVSRRHMSDLRLPPTQMSTLLDIGSRSIFDEDHDIFRQSVRKFMHDELVPAHEKMMVTGESSREIWKRFGDNGFLGISVDAEKGGIGGTFKDEVIVVEEQAFVNCHAPNYVVHSTIVMPYIANYGTQEQVDKFIPKMVAGDAIGAIAMTEPDAGSDLQGIRTHAKKDGDDFIINGSKVFISNGILADVVIVVAVTDPEARSKAHGTTLFLVEEGMPGFKKGRNLNKMGLKAQDTAELFFEDVRVPKSAILGGENKGFYRLMTELGQERLALAVGAIAHSEWMFEETRNYLNNRKAFGGNLSNLQTIRHRLAEMKTSIAVCRAFIDQCIELHAAGKLDAEMASMSKYWATDVENQVAAECVQLHGGWGYMMETPIARAYVDARVQTIYGGTNEIMKELISRSIVKK